LWSSLSHACLVQLVPGIVLNTSLGHILLPPFLFLGLHRNKKPPIIPGGASIKTKPSFLVPLKCTMPRGAVRQDPVPIV
jgi:hypothetical protein